MSELGDDDVEVEVEATQGSAAMGLVRKAGTRATSLVGRRVLVGPIDPCGECEVCRRGGAPVCPLARRRNVIGDHLIATGRWLVSLDDGLALPSPAGAAVAGEVATAYTLYARTGLAARDPVVLVGASPITRFLVEILRAKGIAPAVVADPARAAWGDWLRAHGAAVAPAVGGGMLDEVRAAVLASIATQGNGARPWRVIAITPEAVELAAGLAGPRATLTVLAPGRALPGELATREVTVIGVAGAHPDLVVEAAAMCVKGEIDLADGTSTDFHGANELMRSIVSERRRR
ncbi:MAG: Alcohol dehydrogenase GroES domain protein [Deltaproteobacteria bacterium]|nr:Alcohol dehydrogenase GroES domain protein [Deltaproteobacteria bacterium]